MIFLKVILEADHKIISVVDSVKYAHAFALIVLLQLCPETYMQNIGKFDIVVYFMANLCSSLPMK